MVRMLIFMTVVYHGLFRARTRPRARRRSDDHQPDQRRAPAAAKALIGEPRTSRRGPSPARRPPTRVGAPRSRVRNDRVEKMKLVHPGFPGTAAWTMTLAAHSNCQESFARPAAQVPRPVETRHRRCGSLSAAERIERRQSG